MSHIKHLSKDKKLKKLLDAKNPKVLSRKNDIHLDICSSIISQQLSTKVAAVITSRFMALFDHSRPKPEEILEVPFEKLRGIGLSNAKANYVQNVCRFFIENKLTDKKIHKMEDEELIEFLTQIKGIGRWTSEMILMFTLGREDVFAVDDLGIQQAMTRLYSLDVNDKKKMKEKMILLSENWRPYRTYACLYLWAWKDTAVKKKTTEK